MPWTLAEQDSPGLPPRPSSTSSTSASSSCALRHAALTRDAHGGKPWPGSSVPGSLSRNCVDVDRKCKPDLLPQRDLGQSVTLSRIGWILRRRRASAVTLRARREQSLGRPVPNAC